MSLAQRFKEARSKSGLTQESLAKHCGITRESIQQIENGDTLHPRNIEKLAEALCVSPAWLQFGQNIENNIQVTEEEKSFLKMFRKLDENERIYVIKTIKGLFNHD